MLFFLQLTCRGRHNDAVAAADGNSDEDASTMTPANNRNILTVSANGDSEGKCGGLGHVIPQFDGNVADDTMACLAILDLW
jgi:hypothetical protein